VDEDIARAFMLAIRPHRAAFADWHEAQLFCLNSVMSATGSAPTPSAVDQGVFRDVIGRFASGVTIITTHTGGQDFGTTASAVSSLSMDPPMLLVCLNKTSETQAAIVDAGRFAVNILGSDQTDLAYAFAKKSPDKFRGAEVARGRANVPLFPGALARIECRVAESATGGTHTVFMGEVEQASATEGDPLTYYRGRFGRFEDALQDEAYRRVREFVINRAVAAGEPLEVEQLAARLELEPAHVFYALTKLTGDGLVQRQADGALVVKALDARMAHEAVDARCAIEISVVDKLAGRLDEADATRLRALAEAAHAAAKAEPPDVDGLLRNAQEFHDGFIGLLGNEALLGFYHRLDIGAIWVRASPMLTQRGRPSAAYLIRIIDACAAGDPAEAKRILYKHCEGVKEHASMAIHALGGTA
jgi:flavin reductase (DIM6/NTAB) family NADH-FMN oxidoreductase RutF/DNA-binding GntR family transcriptional regulator